jgi:hypothetical protein
MKKKTKPTEDQKSLHTQRGQEQGRTEAHRQTLRKAKAKSTTTQTPSFAASYKYTNVLLEKKEWFPIHV